MTRRSEGPPKAPVRVMTYGLTRLPDEESISRIERQIFYEFRFKNRVIMHHNEFIEARKKLQASLSPNMDKAFGAAAAAAKALKAKRQEIENLDKLKRLTSDKHKLREIREQRKELMAEAKQLTQADKAAKKHSAEVKSSLYDNPEYRIGVEALTAIRSFKIAYSRADCSVRDDSLEPDADDLRSGLDGSHATISVRDVTESNKYREAVPRRWANVKRRSTIRLGIYPALPATELFSDTPKPLVWIEPLREGAFDDSVPKKEQRRRRATTMHLRIGPVRAQDAWVTLPIKAHELPPRDAEIVEIVLVRERVGTRYVCQVRFVMRTNTPRRLNIKPAKKGTVAINLGWRVRKDEGLRVATYRDNTGHSDVINLPQRIMDRMATVNELQARKDLIYNAFKQELLAWSTTARRRLPDWFREMIVDLEENKSQGELAKLIFRWSQPENRFSADTLPVRDAQTLAAEMQINSNERLLEIYGRPISIFEFATCWLRKSQHLWDWEAGQRRKCLNARKKFYEAKALDLRKDYKTLILPDIDLRVFAKKPKAGEDYESHKKARYNQRLAALSELRAVLIGRFPDHHILPTTNHTKRCHKCGFVNDFDSKDYMTKTCEACGHSWNQDDNAARNLLQDWLESL